MEVGVGAWVQREVPAAVLGFGQQQCSASGSDSVSYEERGKQTKDLDGNHWLCGFGQRRPDGGERGGDMSCRVRERGTEDLDGNHWLCDFGQWQLESGERGDGVSY